jgi:hypothetical protein
MPKGTAEEYPKNTTGGKGYELKFGMSNFT